jgi:hypothetical protein
MRQPARPALQQFQPGGHHRMRRRFQPQPARQHQPQHGARLGILGQRLARGRIDQPIQIHHPAQRLARQRAGQRLVGRGQALRGGMGGIVQRFAPAQHGIHQAQGGTAGGRPGMVGFADAGSSPPPRPYCNPAPAGASGRHDRQPRHPQPPARHAAPGRLREARALDQRARPNPAEAAPQEDPEGLSPTRYGDFTRKGIAWDF